MAATTTHTYYLQPLEDFSNWWTGMCEAGLGIEMRTVKSEDPNNRLGWEWEVTLISLTDGERESFRHPHLPEAILLGYAKCVGAPGSDPKNPQTERNVEAARMRMTDPCDYIYRRAS